MSATMLRIAAILAMMQGVAHAALILFAKPRHGPEEVAVIAAMQGNRFNFGGARRSYWDFYFGYALIAAVICLVEAAVFWQLAGAGSVDPALVRSLVAIFIAFNVVHALLASRHFFITPIVADALVTACLVVACLKAGT